MLIEINEYQFMKSLTSLIDAIHATFTFNCSSEKFVCTLKKVSWKRLVCFKSQSSHLVSKKNTSIHYSLQLWHVIMLWLIKDHAHLQLLIHVKQTWIQITITIQHYEQCQITDNHNPYDDKQFLYTNMMSMMLTPHQLAISVFYQNLVASFW